MSQTQLPPPSSKAKAGSGRRRRFVPPIFLDPDTRSIEIGVAGTILVHLILFLLLPRLMKVSPTHAAPRKQAIPHQFNIQIAPDLFKKPPPPMKYVEANPNAPENTPDKTNNFSFRNQQVAQEKPTKNGKNDMPALEGRKDIKSNQIVTGTLDKQEEQAPIVPTQVAPPTSAVTPPRQEQTPLAGTDKAQGNDANAYGTALAKPVDNAKPIQEKVDGSKDASVVQGATSTVPHIDPRHPQPRKILQQHVRPAIFTENKFGTDNVGVTALDSRWSNYGEYLHRMTEIVQVEWDRILINSATYPPEGSTVSIRFRMNSKGKIEIVDVNNASNEQGMRACMGALTNPQPYGEWTADMVAMLGDSQEMTFSFYYQ